MVCSGLFYYYRTSISYFIKTEHTLYKPRVSKENDTNTKIKYQKKTPDKLSETSYSGRDSINGFMRQVTLEGIA